MTLIETKAIKICHITSAHKTDDVRIFHKECSSLAKNGFDVYLVAANCEETLINDVHIINVTAPTSGRFTRILNTSRIVYKKALELNADIYHIHDPELLPFALKLKKKGKKVIYDAHEDVPKQILGKYWINKYLRKTIAFIFEKYENYVAKRIDYVITATPFIRERFMKVNAACSDINNFPLLSEITSKTEWKHKRNEICYIGGISKIRGIEEVIKSLEETDVKLNLAGAYSPPEFRNELIKIKSWKNVNEYGYVGREKISAILLQSKIGIVTLYPQLNYLDSLPIKMFEYMFAGIPVIASNFPLWKKIVGENKCGICVDPLSQIEIAKAITQLLNDNEKAKELGENGRLAVLKKYNWGIEEKKLIFIYKELSR